MSDPDGFPTVRGGVPRAPMHVRLETRDATGTRCLIRSACVAPQGASHSFFVGGESGLAAFKATESDVRVYNCMEPDARFLGATGHRDDWHFAVDAPEYSNHLVLSGSRRGGVMMYDVRVKPARHRYLLQHSSSIARIKSMGEYNIVVAGLEHTLSIYDRRHLKTSNGLPTGKSPTIPYLDLHNHRNEYDHDMDMAVDSSMHLIAAAQAGDDENIVRIWDSKSGDCVRTLSVKEGWEKDMNGSYKKASQVRFCDLSGSGGPNSLLVAKGTDIMEYGL
jgi:WD40 repeat protein